MRARRNLPLLLAALTLLAFAPASTALAQAKMYSRAPAPTPGAGRTGGYGGGGGGGYRGGGWGGIVPGIIMAIPQMGPPAGGQMVDEPDGPPPGRGRPPQRSVRRGPSGVPPANERRYVPDEVVIAIANTIGPQRIDALQRRFRLQRLEQQRSQLAGTTLYRWRIPDRRSVATVVRALETDAVVAAAQPNYLFTLQQADAKPAGDAPAREGDAAQYELAKLHLPQAHALAKGDNVLVAVIDSGIDATHPELAGSIAGSFDALGGKAKPHAHGTAIAGLIAAHAKLMGAAPDARILAVRAFDPTGASAEGTTFNILKGLDWAAAHGARVINMSFAGPADPALHRSLEAAHRKGIVLIAAAGNAGPNSPPLYPAADADVIAVTATDADDKLFAQSNRGRHIALAAPGADILVASPDGGYAQSSGTSYSAAEISGIAALMLQRKPGLTPEHLRALLLATARDLGPKGPDVMFGAGLADAYGAVTAEDAGVAAARPIERVSTGTR
jgi:hypothetical protein